MGTAARTPSNLHLAAWSFHTIGSTKPNYHMGNRGRASAGICVKGHAWDRPGIQAQGHLVEVRPLSLETLSRSGGRPAGKGVLQFVPSSPNMVDCNRKFRALQQFCRCLYPFLLLQQSSVPFMLLLLLSDGSFSSFGRLAVELDETLIQR